MHLTREEVSMKVPIQRKGTKYIARTLGYLNNSVSVVIAIRDMLKLARNLKELKGMIKDKLIKLNGKPVHDFRQSIRLFNILEADKPYVLSVSPTGRYIFEETKAKERLCKVIGKKLLSKKRIQFNMNDGTNIISKDKINVGDSLYFDFEGKVKKHISLEKGKEVFVFAGKYIGQSGKIESIKDNKAKIKFKGKEQEVELPLRLLITQ